MSRFDDFQSHKATLWDYAAQSAACPRGGYTGPNSASGVRLKARSLRQGGTKMRRAACGSYVCDKRGDSGRIWKWKSERIPS